LSFFFLLSMVALGTFALSSLVATLLACMLVRAPRVDAPVDGLRPLLVRLAPVVVGAVTALLSVSAFLAFEPWHAGAPGPVLGLLGTAGLALVVRGSARAALALRANRTLAFEDAAPFPAPGCALSAFVVTHPFPLVAVVGVRAPRIVLARQVVEALTGHELRAVIGHEIAHWRRRDNLTALALRGLPDVLAWLPAGRRLEAAWAEAAEGAADAEAVQHDAEARVHLASALVKVARLAPAGPSLGLPVAAFHVGAPLATRVEALLHSPVPAGPRTPALPWILGLLALPALVLGHPSALRSVHLATEWLVHALR
jgi:Zn-dependent protease with chaperone function